MCNLLNIYSFSTCHIRILIWLKIAIGNPTFYIHINFRKSEDTNPNSRHRLSRNVYVPIVHFIILTNNSYTIWFRLIQHVIFLFRSCKTAWLLRQRRSRIEYAEERIVNLICESSNETLKLPLPKQKCYFILTILFILD